MKLHDEALAAVSPGRFAGPVRVGMVQDFADNLLAGVLAQFAEVHPDAQIYARVAGTADLQAMLERDQLDIVVGFAGADDPAALRTAPMVWFGERQLTEQERAERRYGAPRGAHGRGRFADFSLVGARVKRVMNLFGTSGPSRSRMKARVRPCPHRVQQRLAGDSGKGSRGGSSAWGKRDITFSLSLRPILGRTEDEAWERARRILAEA